MPDRHRLSTGNRHRLSTGNYSKRALEELGEAAGWCEVKARPTNPGAVASACGLQGSLVADMSTQKREPAAGAVR